MADSDDDDYELPSLAERIQASLKVSSIVKSVKTHGSDSEESEFLQFSERIRNTPCSEVKKLKFDSSDSEKEESESLKKRIHNSVSSEIKLKLHLSSSGSESDESEFLNFSERIRNTPQSHYRPKQYNEDSDRDETFSNFITKFREINTPKPQNKYKETPGYLSSVPEKQSLSNSSDYLCKTPAVSEDTSKATGAQAENRKEYDSLFPTRSDDSLFRKKRAFYTKALFDFFNRKVFNYQLPKDMPLIWDESLMKTAGLTYCKRKKNVYSCSIKLSSKLLISFDRLQDTLLHEMCHAAVWMINNQDVGHGPLWQIWASRSKLILPFIDCPARCHTYDVPYRFWYQCTKCNWKRGTCRRIKRYHGAVCKRCNIPITLTVKN